MFMLIFLALTFPASSAFAAVSISEVAWMGSSESANYEWIELVNESTASVNVEGWTLSDGMNLTIGLSGSIPPETYVLAERNRSDGAYYKQPPFVTYSGALVNTGATLTLRDSSGMIIDQVVGGADWEQIGGDNTTKETAQYATSGWVTAPATPGLPNALTGRAPGTKPTNQTGAHTSGKRTNKTTVLGVTTPVAPTVTQKDTQEALILTPNVPAIAYVGQPLTLSVEPSGLTNKTIMNSLQYRWNFGDSYAQGGKSVEHTYRYPGEYVVSVAGTFASRKQEARTTITVLPVQLSLTRNDAGDLQLHNNAPYEIALDGYRIAGVSSVVLPAQTTLLPRATITIDHRRLKATADTPVIVYDAGGRVITSTLTPNSSVAESVAFTTQPSVSAPQFGAELVRFIPQTEASVPAEVVPPATITPAPTTTPVVVPLATKPTPRLPERTFFGLVGILLVSISALYLLKPRAVTSG